MPLVFGVMLSFLLFKSTNHSCSVDSSQETSTSLSTDSSAAADSDWTKKGTTANKTAESVFKAFVNSGTSGAFSAGVVGWVNSEGGFAMIGRAEGHYGNDLKTNSIAYGVRPTGLSYYTTEAGGGIFQFTPFTKYAPLGSPDWEDADKMIAFVIKAVATGDWTASMDLTGKNHSFEEAVKLTDPQEAALTWQAYERGSVAHINQAQKKADAQKAYELFGGSSYQYDDTKFKKVFGKNSDKSLTGNTSSTETTKDNCSGSNSGGSGAWSEDKTGKVSYGAFNAWKPSDLPEDLKQYALDPKSLDMGYKDSKNWSQIAWSGGQCTDLSASLMYHLWEKEGKHPSQKKGNGSEVVANWISAFGGRADSPKAGAVFSETPASAGGLAGHTGVVSHVFSNGDILVVEQNYSKLSGEDGGFGKYTWSYRYVPKAQQDKGVSFYSPAQAGYKLSNKAKAMK